MGHGGNGRKLSQTTLVIDDAAREEGTASCGAESRFAAPARANAKSTGFAPHARAVRRRGRRARLPGRAAGSDAGHGLPHGADGQGICGDSAAGTDAGFCGGSGGPRPGRTGSVAAGHEHGWGGHGTLRCRQSRFRTGAGAAGRRCPGDARHGADLGPVGRGAGELSRRGAGFSA